MCVALPERSTVAVCDECKEHYCTECIDTHTCGTNVMMQLVRVQATVGVGTVLIWYFGVAYTRGGGVTTTCSRVTAVCALPLLIPDAALSLGGARELSFLTPITHWLKRVARGKKNFGFNPCVL